MTVRNHSRAGRRSSNRTGSGARRASPPCTAVGNRRGTGETAAQEPWRRPDQALGPHRAAIPAVLAVTLAAQLGFASRKPRGVRARATRWKNIIARRLAALAERGSR